MRCLNITGSYGGAVLECCVKPLILLDVEVLLVYVSLLSHLQR